MPHSRTFALVLLVSSAIPSAAQPTEPTPPVDPAAPTPPPEPEPAPAAPAEPAAPPVVAPDLPAVKLERAGPPKPNPLELEPGGYVHFDSRRLLTETEAHEMTVRRLRFKLDGKATRYFKFRALLEFAGSKLVVQDAWAEVVVRPELAFRAGKDKSQFGIERLQSATQLTFLERAYPTQLSPNRDIGVWARGELDGGLVHYAVGAVDGVANNAVLEGESDDVLEFNLHLLISPFAGRKELGDLGIGGATTFGRTSGTATNPGVTNVRSAGQATIVKYTTSSAMDAAATARADGYRTRFAGHAYYYRGPLGVLAEYVRDREPVRLMGSTTLIEHQAWQLASSVALTRGDHPTYKGMRPRESFDPEQGSWGALELAGRYSELRIDPASFDLGITGKGSVETAREYTVGGNWYFNAYLKLQLDYSLTTFTSNDPATALPDEHLIATRLQAAI